MTSIATNTTRAVEAMAERLTQNGSKKRKSTGKAGRMVRVYSSIISGKASISSGCL